MGERTLALDFQLHNAFNKEHASFLSRYETYALDPGRNFVVRLGAEF